MNFFESRLSAARYADARPGVHRAALSTFMDRGHLTMPIGSALDVACGTGQSTVALAEFADQVVGIDPSEAMVRQGVARPGIAYVRSMAETIPVGDARFDLLTVGLAFHWLDQDAFLLEARRVLKQGGWLVVYNAWFTGDMLEDPDFAAWFREQYVKRFPAPPRVTTPITAERVRAFGFEWGGESGFSVDAPMSVRRFTDYQLSTSNIIAAVQDQESRFVGAEQWIAASITRYFDSRNERTFRFAGKSCCMRKCAE